MANANINIWSSEIATGHRDPDDPELITVAWATREGVKIESIDLLEGTMLVVKARIPLINQIRDHLEKED